MLDPLLIWLESTALSQWVVASPSLLAFPGILALHAIGMGFAAGLSAMFDLRVLGAARSVPLAEFERYLPVLWLGFWVNAVSGVLLLIGYPTKALTNPVFYLKLLLIGVAMTLVARTRRELAAVPADQPGFMPGPSSRLRRMAIVSLVCWTGAITAGRLLAYTYSRLTQYE
jgi:hypothetical protein